MILHEVNLQMKKGTHSIYTAGGLAEISAAAKNSSQWANAWGTGGELIRLHPGKTVDDDPDTNLVQWPILLLAMYMIK